MDIRVQHRALSPPHRSRSKYGWMLKSEVMETVLYLECVFCGRYVRTYIFQGIHPGTLQRTSVSYARHSYPYVPQTSCKFCTTCIPVPVISVCSVRPCHDNTRTDTYFFTRPELLRALCLCTTIYPDLL